MSWLFKRYHPATPTEPIAFHDKAWKRADQAAWDDRWTRLSVAARKQYLGKIKANTQKTSSRPVNSFSPFSPAIIEEWRKAGLIRDENGGRQPGFVVVDDALGFTARLRALQRYGLLDESSAEVEKYISLCFVPYQLAQVLDKIIEKQTGLSRHAINHDPIQMFVKRRRWPDWVASYLDDPLAGPVVAAVESAHGSVPLSRLHERLPKSNPLDVRLTVDRLVNHLVLVEDLDPDTLEIQVGLLPAVLKERQRAAQTVALPPLEPATPAQSGPEGGLIVPDLRALLLEVTSQPPRLKQNHSLFQKEEDRFHAALDPLPDWLAVGQNNPPERLERAHRQANQANLTQVVDGAGGAVVLDLTAEGRRWLASSIEEQYALLYEFFRTPEKDAYWAASNDSFFLGSNITAVPMKSGKQPERQYDYYKPMTPQDRQPLRDALYRTFAELPLGTFFRLEEFVVRATTGARNPLLLGGDASRVTVRQDLRIVPPLEEFLEDAGRNLLRALLQVRLIPLGCVQIARDAGNRLLLARLPRLDVYFGKAKVAPTAPQMEETRVIVQPDFSVIVIGLNPAPVAELAPFCERVRGRASHGSITFRISRESVLKGLTSGLPPEQVLERLKKHSTTPLPKNVATEVSGWCKWARKVTPTPALLLRCPDAEAAGRVMGALGKHGERVGDTIVAVALDGLTSALRQKLQGQGILLDREPRRKKK